MNGEQPPAAGAVGGAIYDRFYAALAAQGADAERLAAELRALQELDELQRDSAIIGALDRVLRQTS